MILVDNLIEALKDSINKSDSLKLSVSGNWLPDTIIIEQFDDLLSSSAISLWIAPYENSHIIGRRTDARNLRTLRL